MTFTLYRADNRDPDAIASTGFQGRVALDTDTARALVQRAVVSVQPEPGEAPLRLPATEKPMTNAFASQPTPALLGLGAMYNAIRNERSHGTTHVSTARDDGCMGADARHVYKIELPVQQMYAWDSRGRGISDTPRAVDSLDRVHQGSIHPVLLTDSPRLQDARIIAISDRNGEVAFQTGIPADWVTRSRERASALQPDPAWNEMPAAPGRSASTPASTPAAATPVAQVAQVAQVASAPAPAPEAARAAAPPAPPPKPATLSSHAYADPTHERHALYAQALGGLSSVAAPGLRTSTDRTHAAAALADAAHQATPRLPSIDQVVAGPNGRLFAVHGRLDEPANQRVHIDPAAPGHSGPAYAQSAPPAQAAQAQATQSQATQSQAAQPQAAQQRQDAAAAAPERTSVLQLARQFEAQQAESQGGSGPRR